MKHIALVLFIFFLCSCSAEKRLNRLLALHPEFTRHDTITIVDTVVVERVQTDTIAVLTPGDTLYVDRDRLHVRVVKMPGDSIFVQGVCDPDIVVVTREVVTNRIAPTRTIAKTPWWIYVVMLVLAAIALLQTIDARNRS